MGKPLRCWGNLFYAFLLLFVWSGRKKFNLVPGVHSPREQRTLGMFVTTLRRSKQTILTDGCSSKIYWMLCSWSNRSDKYYPKLQILQILVTWTALSLILQRDTTVNITTCFLLATPRKATTKETFYWPHPGKPRALTDAPTPEVGNWRNERLGCYPDLGCCSYWYLKMFWRKLTLPNHQVTMLQSTLKSVTILLLSEC